MATVIELNAQLEALRAARATGLRSVEFASGSGSSRKVTYRDDHELAAAISAIEALLAGQTTGKTHTILISTSKGF